MVRIPSPVRRSGSDEDAERDERTDEVVTDKQAGGRRDRAVGTAAAPARSQVDERSTTTYRGRTATDRDDPDRTVPDVTGPRSTTGPDTAPAAPARRARTSMLATMGLILGVVAALMVLSGILAGYGIAVGVLALLLSLGGVSATRRPHVAGKSDALIGAMLALGAIVIGGLALTGSLTWLTTQTDQVGQLREWLDTNIADRF